MPKLVILNQGMTGRTFDVNVERTTVGRIEENTFQIADASVSSRHAEILLHGTELLVRDLNSTNGTFINGDKITEAVLKPGQILRFGQVELKIDDGLPVPSAAPMAAPAPVPAPAQRTEAATPKKAVDSTMIIPRGVSLEQLEQGGGRPAGFDTNKAFAKKSNQTNRWFLIIGVIVFVLIVGILIYALSQAGPAR
jgi:pSer/pThr/pTyr-binding forkhead associated (FHA) protein